MNCEYCGNQFQTKNSLDTHQKRAKYCLNLRQETPKVIFKCEICNKEFTYKISMTTHQINCEKQNSKNSLEIDNTLLKEEIERLKDVYKKEIDDYKDEIIELKNTINKLEGKGEILKEYFDADQETIKAIASKSTNTITNTSKNKITINNRLDLSYERLAPFAENYTMEHFKRGSAGIADWAGENFLFDANKEPLYVCSDKARKNFIYIDEKGNRIRDEHAETLRNQIKPVLEHKMKECNRVNYAWLAENDDDNNEFTEKMFKLHKDNREIGPDFDKRLIEITKRN